MCEYSLFSDRHIARIHPRSQVSDFGELNSRSQVIVWLSVKGFHNELFSRISPHHVAHISVKLIMIETLQSMSISSSEAFRIRCIRNNKSK